MLMKRNGCEAHIAYTNMVICLVHGTQKNLCLMQEIIGRVNHGKNNFILLVTHGVTGHLKILIMLILKVMISFMIIMDSLE